MKQYLHYPYYVSEDGQVYRKGKTKPLKQDILPNGRHRVTLCIGGKIERFLVHRLVATLYCENPENKPDVLHGDNDPSNNHYLNLRWGTQSENMQQCHEDGRCSNIIASEKARELQLIKTETKLKELLGDRFNKLVYKHNRLYIDYSCICGNKFQSRTDSVCISRGGLCRHCKDEDIV